ncbi:MAG: flavin prenyltransferase UbiX [Pirellulaceae bacterium]
MSSLSHPVVIAISGASGAVYSVRLLQQLARAGIDVELTISDAGRQVIKQELEIDVDLEQLDLSALLQVECVALTPIELPSLESIRYYHYRDLMSPMASGSHRTEAMVICPCSGATLGNIANGTSSNLIQRAADVHLKERRRLLLVTRETPLSSIHIENMRRVTQAGAIVLPASPGWYQGVTELSDLVDFMVARILDQLGCENDLMGRWGDQAVDCDETLNSEES